MTLSTVAASYLADGDVWTVEVTPKVTDGPDEFKGPTSRAEVTVNIPPHVEIALNSTGDTEQDLTVQIVKLEDPNEGDPEPDYTVEWTVDYINKNGEEISEVWEPPSPNAETVPAAWLSEWDKWSVTVTPYTPLPDGYSRSEAFGEAKSDYVIFYPDDLDTGHTGDTGWWPDSGWHTGWHTGDTGSVQSHGVPLEGEDLRVFVLVDAAISGLSCAVN